MTELYLDAETCPLKDQAYQVAARHRLRVYVVSTGRDRTPSDLRIMPVVVEGGRTAAAKWIADRARSGDVVITADIPLAERALKAGARAVHPDGRVFPFDGAAGKTTARGFVEVLDEAVVKALRAAT